MKTIRRFSLVFSAIFFLTFAVNTFDSFAFEPGWIYGNYEAVVAGYDFSLEIGFESGTDLDCMYFTGYHTDVYEQFYTCDNVVFHGINEGYTLIYNGNDKITMYRPGGFEIEFHKTADASHYAN
jgi:hypothetical protein